MGGAGVVASGIRMAGAVALAVIVGACSSTTPDDEPALSVPGAFETVPEPVFDTASWIAPAGEERSADGLVVSPSGVAYPERFEELVVPTRQVPNVPPALVRFESPSGGAEIQITVEEPVAFAELVGRVGYVVDERTGLGDGDLADATPMEMTVWVRTDDGFIAGDALVEAQEIVVFSEIGSRYHVWHLRTASTVVTVQLTERSGAVGDGQLDDVLAALVFFAP